MSKVDDILNILKHWENYKTITTRCVMDTFNVSYATAYKVVKQL